jgi:DNA-binding transcriptional ArsR family regulator
VAVNQLDSVFGALADPTRRAIIAQLAQGDRTVGELAAPFAMSQPAVSRHLKVLESAGLITRSRRATALGGTLRAARRAPRDPEGSGVDRRREQGRTRPVTTRTATPIKVIAEPGLPFVGTERELDAPRDLVFRCFAEP